MKSWTDFGMEINQKDVLVDDSSKRRLVGLKTLNKVVVETSYNTISDPIYDTNDPEVVFGVVENFYRRCGIFSIKVPFDETEKITIYWFPNDVKSVKYLSGRVFWLHNIIMKPVWVACFRRGEWEIHPLM